MDKRIGWIAQIAILKTYHLQHIYQDEKPDFTLLRVHTP